MLWIMTEQKGGVLHSNGLGLILWDRRHTLFNGHKLTKLTDHHTSPMGKYHKILWLVHLLSHHKWPAPGIDWWKTRLNLFERSWPSCLAHTRVWLTAYTPAQMSHTNHENGTEFVINELVRCESTLSSGVLSVLTKGVSAAALWKGLKRKVLVPF